MAMCIYFCTNLEGGQKSLNRTDHKLAPPIKEKALLFYFLMAKSMTPLSRFRLSSGLKLSNNTLCLLCNERFTSNSILYKCIHSCWTQLILTRSVIETCLNLMMMQLYPFKPAWENLNKM